MQSGLKAGWAILALGLLASGCGPRWPKDTLSMPSYVGAETVQIAKHHLVAYSVPAEAKLPAWAKAKGPNQFLGPSGSELFIIMSRPWPTEEEAMGTVMAELKSGKPFDSGDAMVVARPWIGSKEPKEPLGGKRIDRYLLMTEDLFLDMVVRVPLDNQNAVKEAQTMVQYVVHSIKRVPPPPPAYRLTKSGNDPAPIASATSVNSLR